ncbi:MAG TPA: glycosyltransferase family 4 protein, partial [Deltaproteobacteria bacterium]|nr:glycosyltransferase family 4 protein [Deltaproteobacteria bacterium]
MTSPTLADKRIIILFGSLDMGGAERQGLILARHLKADQQADVQVWGLGRDHGPVANTCAAWGIACKNVWLHWGLRRRLPHLLRLALQLRQARPDILISYTKVPNIAAALLWRFCGARVCIWNQADAGLLLEPGWLNRLAIARVRHFISNAEIGRQYLLKTFGLEPGRLKLIRNGIALPPAALDRRAWRERLAANEQQPVVTMVANLSRFKDHATLLQAWKDVLERSDALYPPLLALAGRFDDQADMLRQQAQALGIINNVRFLGPLDDISGLLQASDICVHSSRSEGIPNAILEAMLCGLPVAGTDIPGIREAVGEEAKDFLAEPGNAAQLADRICRLIDSRQLRESQGKLMQ